MIVGFTAITYKDIACCASKDNKFRATSFKKFEMDHTLVL